MSLIKRLTVAVAAAVLAGPLMAVPAAHAAGDYVCDGGTFFNRPYGSTLWHVWGNPCTGSGDGGVSLITLSSGPFAGVYQCDRADWLSSTWVSGSTCTRVGPFERRP
ncbi:hypothetical protein [Streptosporangium sp. NPDC051022]|uniref:hypothetical protein n=1 Tax=Streptosporangium sp. NPDC051022 TaxID=3155752 RepID=UPI0034423CD9